MPVTNYDTLHGEIIAEYTDGVQLDYLKDALGSVTAWVDQNCNIVATARYKPFGDILVSTGTLGRFTWVGTLGYRTTGLGVANFYVRARHYASQQGIWNTVDPLWPRESAYGYASASPSSKLDPAGKWPVIIFPRSCRRTTTANPIIMWPGPCKEADREVCNKACGPAEGRTTTSDGSCLCYCDVFWTDCGLIDILSCITFCKKINLVYVRCNAVLVEAKFDPLKDCECKKP